MVPLLGRRGVRAALTALAVAVGVLGPLSPTPAGAAAAAPGRAAVTARDPGTYVPVTPYRLLDTRKAVGTRTTTPVPANGSVTVTAGSTGSLPAGGIGAVAVTLTVVGGTSSGYLTAYAAGQLNPGTSNLNWVTRQTVANGAVVPVSLDGRFVVRSTSPGTTHVVVDVTGYYLAGKPGAAGTFAPMAPARVLDTRRRIGVSGTTPLANGAVVRVPVAARGTTAAGGASVLLNLTVTAPTASGYATVGGPAALPYGGSALNWRAGQTVANLVLAAVDPDGRVALQVTSIGGTAHLVADLVGFTTSGPLSRVGTTLAQRPYRLADTRKPVAKPVAASGTLVVHPGLAPQHLVAGDVSAVVVDVVVTAPVTSGYLTAWPTGAPLPSTSSLNWAAGQTVAAAVIVPVGADGTISLRNVSGGTAHFVVDLEGVVLARQVDEATEWTSDPVPDSDPGAGAAAAVLDVGCAAGPTCAVLGTSVSAAGTRSTVVRRWDGAVWGQPEPVAAGSAPVGSAACSDSGLCVAAAGSGTGSTLLSSDTSFTWSMQAAPPDADGRVPVVADVTCAPGGASCLAVGSARAAGTGAPVPWSAVWSAGTWSNLPVPLGPGLGDQGALVSVACASENACTAVGSATLGGVASPLTATWGGTAWTTQTFAVDGVTGSAVATRVAVRGGDVVVTGTGGGRPFVAVGAGFTWNAAPVAALTRGAFLGGALACDGGGGCWASTSQGLASVPDPAPVTVVAGGGAGATALASLSCAASWCVGTAAMGLTAVADRGVVLDSAGGSDGSWAAAVAPSPFDAVERGLDARVSSLAQVACWSGGCLLVGPYPARTGGQALKADVLLRG